MEFINRTVYFSPHDMLIMVGDNIDPSYKDSLPEVAFMPFSDSISESDPRVVGVIMESEQTTKLASGISMKTPLSPATLNEFSMKNEKSDIKCDGIFKRFQIPVAFFKVDKMDDLMYINNYIKTIQLFSDYGMEFPDELAVAKKHYGLIRKQCDIQQGITNFKVKTQIYDMVFV